MVCLFFFFNFNKGEEIEKKKKKKMYHGLTGMVSIHLTSEPPEQLDQP